MGKYTKYRALPDQAYDPRVTDLRSPFNMPAATGPMSAPGYGAVGAQLQAIAPPTTGNGNGNGNGSQWINRNITNMVPYLLVAGVSIRALPNNPKRTGLEIQNKDAAATLNYSFSNDLGLLGLGIGPGGAALYDFTTPPDALYLISGITGGANIQVIVLEISRAG